jgi:repressor LexA
LFEFIPNLWNTLCMAKKESPSTGKAELTARQITILNFIKTATESQGYAPSMREIGEAAGLNSPASVSYQLDILQKKGLIRRDAERGRAMEVILPESMTGEGAHADKTRFIPLVGSIAAGVPITADQQVEETFPLPESLVG